MSFEARSSIALLVAFLAGCSAASPPHDSPAPQSSANPPVEAAPVAAASAIAPPPGPSYVACGCGCCGGVEPRDACLYKSKGDSLDKIIAQDKNDAQSSICPMAGCSKGVRYHYCD